MKYTIDFYWTKHFQLEDKLRHIPRGKVSIDDVIDNVSFGRRGIVNRALKRAFKKLEKAKNAGLNNEQQRQS